MTEPLPVPDSGDRVNHEALSLADQVKVPPPVLLIASVWAAGFVPPCVAVKDRLVGLAPMAGGTGAAVTVKVTGTETGEAPVAVNVIVAVYVPVASVPKVVVTVAEPLPVPDAGESVNHAALSLADQVSVPPPVLLIVRV